MQTRLFTLSKPITNGLVAKVKNLPAETGSISLIDGQIINNNKIKWNKITVIAINNIKVNNFNGYLFLHHKLSEILNFCWTSEDNESIIYTIPSKSQSNNWNNFLPIKDETGEFKILAEYDDEIDNSVVPDNAPPEFKFQLVESYFKSILGQFGLKNINNFWSGEWTTSPFNPKLN